MGSSLDRYLDRGTPGDSPSTSGVDDYLNGRPPKAALARLQLSTNHAAPDPERAARVLQLQQRTQLPTDLIERNFDEIDQRSRATNYDPVALQQSSPVVAAWMAEHPNNAAVAADDLDKLTFIEKLVHGFKSGVRQSRLGILGNEAQQRRGIANLDASQREELRRLEADIASEPNGGALLNRFLYRSAQYAGQFALAAPEALRQGARGAVAGGTTAAILGPGAIVGTGSGFGVGATYGVAHYSAMVEGGQAYLTLSRMLTETGQPIDEDTKQAISTTVGLINGVLEATGVEFIAAPYKTAVKKFIRESVKDALIRPTMRRALNDVGRSYLTSIAGEVGQEVAQEITNVIGEEFARTGDAGKLDELLTDPEKRDAMWVRLADIAQQTAEGMVLMAAPGAAIHGAATAHQARLATQREQFFLALGDAVKGSKTLERLPEGVQEIVRRATADGPIETVYAPVDTWDGYWQSARIDPAAAARELGVEKEWREAHATGGDIAIPTTTYATKIAPTDHNAFFAKELRARPNEMNAREAAEFSSKVEEAATQATAEAASPAQEADTIRDSVAQQLVAAGYDEQSARTNAEQMSAFFRTQAQRAGMDPLELFRRYNFSVTKQEVAPAAPVGTKVPLEAVAERALTYREAKAERQALEGEAQRDTGPYALSDQERDRTAKTDAGEFVYARTPAGSIRSNITKVSTDGLIDELNQLFEAQQGDRQLEERFNAWNESGEAAFLDALPDAERTGRSRRTTDQFGNKIKRTVEDLPDADATMDPVRLAAMRQLERDYRKASRSIEARKKIVAKIEGELQRRGVTDANERLFKRMTGDDLAGTDFSFEQSALTTDNPYKITHLRLEQAKGPYARWIAMATEAANPNNSPEIRAEAARRAADIEQTARAEHDAEMRRSTEEYEARTGHTYPTKYYQTAFHGSPHVFDRFSLHKIGTGEGAQAYGWGLYFAGKKEVAAFYREKLSAGKSHIVGPDGASLSWGEATRHVQRSILENAPLGGTASEGELALMASSELLFALDKGENLENAYWIRSAKEPLRSALERGAKALEGYTVEHPKGRLYEVALPEDETFLDWDKPLNEQPALVQDALNKDWAAHPEAHRLLTGASIYNALGKDLANKAARDEGWTGVVNTLNDSVVDQEAASRHLASLGINGIRYLDASSRRQGEGSYNYVVFDDQLVNIVGYEQAFPGGEAPRGHISFSTPEDDAVVSIGLLADADLSTFLHESGHFYLRVMQDLAADANAAPAIVADFAEIKKWVGWQEGQTALTREQHEQWARGFEAYLMEGKAPSSELRGAFGRFRAWLVGLYRSFGSLQALLSDEVRGVMDRLLATEDEIRAAQSEQHMEPLFSDPAAVGMTVADADRYRSAVLEARRTAEDELARKLMDDVRREQDKVYQAERARVRDEVAAEVNDERDSQAYALLSRGTRPDGTALPEELEAVKLSKTALAAEYEGRYPDLMRRLRMGFLYAKEGGEHPDVVAGWFGYGSGDELIHALLTYEGTPKQRIERLTDERMRADDPNLVTPAELPVEAMKAVHNEKRAEVLHLELRHLASENLPALKGLVRRIARRLPALLEVRQQADRVIANKRVRDINPLLYQRAEEKAARMAVDALLRGDVELAFDEKQRELLNHELYRSATTAREDVERVATDLARFSTARVRENLGKAGGDYLAQIDALLARFDFRKSVSMAALDRRRSLREWYEEQAAAGLAPLIPEKLLDEAYRTHYKDLTLSDLKDVHEAVQSIEHLARLKNRLLVSARAREMDEARTEIIGAIGDNHSLRQRPEGHAPDTLRKRLAKGTKRGIAEHTRMEFLFDFLDGFKGGVGVVWQYLFKPFADAETAENELRATDAKALSEIFAAYTDRERAAWFTEKVYIPDAGSTRHDGNFSKASIIAAALNWGNDYNRQALMDGYDWTLGQVESILSRLDERDWRTVQRIWDHIETYWPAIEQLEKDLSGVAPQKVQATSFTMKGVQMRGGYYPILFDRERSTRQTSLDEKSNVQEMFGGNWARAMTRHGHTIERTNTGGKPLKLELSGLADHLGQVAHDLTHRRAVIDVYRLVSDDDIAKAIELAVGREMYLQLKPWLNGIAGDRARSYSGFMERVLGRARQGATVVGLGLKVTSALLQSLGYTITVNELGPKYAGKGLADAFGNPRRIRSQWQFITERSPMMRDRLENYDRDIRDYARRKGTLEGAEGAWFYFIGYMDLATSIPTWLGAYRKAMDGAVAGMEGGQEELAIDYADKVVRQTQAAGAAKDLASVQRGGEAWRLFTMFYSSMSIIFNQLERAGQRYALTRNAPQLAATIALIWFAPVVLEAAIRGEQPDDDEGWAKFLAKKIAAYPFGTVVLVRDLVGSLERRDFSLSPVAEIGSNIRKAVLAAGKALHPDEITRAEWKALVNTIGYLAKLPSAQVWKTVEYLHDWMTGIEQPDNIASGLYHTLISGKPRP